MLTFRICGGLRLSSGTRSTPWASNLSSLSMRRSQSARTRSTGLAWRMASTRAPPSSSMMISCWAVDESEPVGSTRVVWGGACFSMSSMSRAMVMVMGADTQTGGWRCG